MISEPRLNLASGQNRIKGFFNIDRVKAKNVDAVMDLENLPWAIASESAEEIVCNHYLEHTPMETYGRRLVQLIYDSVSFEDLKAKVRNIDMNAPSDGLILFMEEVYRILRPGGTILFTSPYYQSGVCWQDPTHRRAITENTFKYFNKKWRTENRLDHYGITSDFEINHLSFSQFGELKFTSTEEKTYAMRHLGNVIAELRALLTKRDSLKERPLRRLASKVRHQPCQAQRPGGPGGPHIHRRPGTSEGRST